MGPYGYQVGAFGPGWSEWNDRFRNYVRDFWRGNTHGVAELAQRVTGSPDIFNRDGRLSSASVNFITAHDGFTMRDLVTYDVKHNGANGESNRDGSDDNRSWNCGVEGETDHAHVNALRHRQAQNLMATLLLANGVPMITAGDELGRTQQGNNNAYCQDSPISWVHWDTSRELAGPDRADPEAAEAAGRVQRVQSRGLPARRAAARRQGASDRAQEHRLVRRPERRDDHRRLARRHAPDARPLSRRRQSGPGLRLGVPDLVPRRRRPDPGRAARRAVGAHLFGGRPHRRRTASCPRRRSPRARRSSCPVVRWSSSRSTDPPGFRPHRSQTEGGGGTSAGRAARPISAWLASIA